MHGRGGCRGRGAGRSGAPSSVPLPHDDPAHWGRVRSALAGAPLRSVRDLQQALSHYNSATAACTFSPLVMLLSGDPAQEREFFGARLHGIIGLALELPALFPSRLPVLDRAPCRAALTRKQVASLLANIFLSTFPERRRARGQAEAHALSPVDCLVLFGLGEGRGGQEGGDAGSDARLCAEKLKCLLHYFGFALQRLREDGAWAAETVEVVRRGSPTRGTDWRASAARLGDITVTVRSEGRIEEAAADFEADFANAHVGGGVLGRGCVQEEIRFLIAPELIVSKVLCSRLADDESLLICGAQVVSRYTGYRQSFRWSGPVHPPESEGATRRVVTVMDALDTHRHPARQFSRKHMVRELDKAAGAFARLSPPASACCGAQSNTVATGNWGCGAFGGDVFLKFVIQVLAAASQARDLDYYTCRDGLLAQRLTALFAALSPLTVGVVATRILEMFDSGYLETKAAGNSEELGELFYTDLLAFASALAPCTSITSSAQNLPAALVSPPVP